MDDISLLIESGEEIIVIDNTTGEDITTTILSQLVSKNLSGDIQGAPSEVLTRLIRKGRGEFFNFARSPVGLLHRAASLTSDGIDKIEDFININQDDAVHDDDQVIDEILHQNSELKKWITNRIDESIERALKNNNLATKKQIATLNADISELSAKIEALMK